jgi:short-subunit dehydrogenase
MMVNYFGTLQVIRAFEPVIEKHGAGAIVNVLSMAALAGVPAIGGYSASKAALSSATQSLRYELSKKKISVHGVFPGPIETDMTKGMEFQMKKADVKETAKNVVRGLLEDQEDIYPDEMSVQLSKVWAKDPKSIEKQLAEF